MSVTVACSPDSHLCCLIIRVTEVCLLPVKRSPLLYPPVWLNNLYLDDHADYFLADLLCSKSIELR